MKTFTTYAEKKAKQFLNLLQGYTKGIRITAILILLLMGVSNAWAVDHTGGYIYFLKPSTWTESKVMMFIGHDSYTSVFEMTQVSNTDNLYRYTMPSWGGATYVAFANDSYVWGTGNWGPSNRTNAKHYTNVYNNYGFNSGSYYVVVPASTSNNAGITINYKSSASNLNLTTRANVYGSTDGGSTYASMAAAGTVSVSGYYMSNSSTASTRSAVSSTSSQAYASTTLAPGSIATFKATASDGYEFVGWFDAASGGTAVSTSTTYTYKYDISYTGKTVYARFKKQYKILFGVHSSGHGSLTAKVGDTSISSGNRVNYGSEVVFTAKPDDGYQIEGWYSNTACTTPIDNGTNDTYTVTITIGTNVYVKFVEIPANSHNITYTEQGAGWTYGNSNPTTAEEGATVTFVVNPTAGYSVDVSSDGPALTGPNANNQYTFTMPTKDVKITVEATPEQYTVTLNKQSGTGGPSSVTATYLAAMPTITPPTRTGYTFNGYFDATSGGTKYYNADGSSAKNWDKTSNTTLYAQWTAKQYTITYKDQNNATFSGTHANGYPTKHTYGTATTLKTATKTGYTFDGWFTTSACTGTAVTSLGATDYTSNITLYAKWTELPPTTIYIKSDGNYADFKWNYNSTAYLMDKVDCDGTYYTADILGGVEEITLTGSNNFTTTTLTVPTDDKKLYDLTSTTHLYLKPNSNWTQSNARFAAYFFGDGEEWVNMTAVTGQSGLYEVTIPTGKSYTSVIFCRMNPSSNTNGWTQDTQLWNQTNDLNIPTDGKNQYAVAAGAWSKGSGTWSAIYDNNRWTTFEAPTLNVQVNITGKGSIVIDGETYTSITTGTETFAFTKASGENIAVGAITPAERWAYNKDAKIEMCDEEKDLATSHTITGPAVITLSFTQESCEVVFNLNLPKGIVIPSWSIANQTVAMDGTATEPTSVGEIGEYLFGGWYENGSTFTDANKYDFSTPVTGDLELFARWIPYAQCIFFKNNLKWKDVYAYTFSDDAWDASMGVKVKDRYIEYGKMTQIGQTDVYYYTLTNTTTGFSYIAFSETDMHNNNEFYGSKAIYRGDRSDQMPLFIPQTDQEASTTNTTKYYSSGIWMKYNSTESGYKWSSDKNNWSTDVNPFTASTKGGYTFTTTVSLSGDTKYQFKVNNIKSDWYSKVCTITQDECTNLWFQPESDPNKNAVIQPNVTGNYVFTVYLGDGKVELSLEYPLIVGDYRLSYYDAVTGLHPGHYIKKRNEDRRDTVSFFVHVENNPEIRLEHCTAIDANTSTATWEILAQYNVLKTISAHPSTAMSPGRRNADGTIYIGDGCGIDSTGVYNFVLQQSNSQAEADLATDATHKYEGHYYIRTDAADGGWDSFRQESNLMTYNSYADEHEDFDHYFCHWVEKTNNEGEKNVQFTIANDYSYCISDTLKADPSGAGQVVTNEHGHLPNKLSANVRFGWDSKTNAINRAYIAGANNETQATFLHLMDAENLQNSEGTAVTDINFKDMQNWIYQVDVKATNATKIKLVAEYAGKEQYFKGAEGDGEGSKIPLLSSTAQSQYNIRLIYNFKCNHLVAAMVLGGDKEVEKDDALGTDMMVIRRNQGHAEQLTFNPDSKKLTEVGTVYAVMTFTSEWINGTAKARERSLYWVSFPFDVKVSDVFGFGEYGEEWILQYYDGAERAEKGLFGDSGTYWKYIEDTKTTLNAGTGYVLALDLSKVKFLHGAEVSLYFPSTKPLTTISGKLPTAATVPAHECTIDREWTEGGTKYHHKYTDSHWNLIGVPGFADIDFDLAKTGYHFMQNDASFYYNFKLAESTYAVEASQVTEFQAMYAYMVQFAGTINWTSSEVSGVARPELVAPRNSDAEPEKVVLRLELAQGEEEEDHTFVQLQQEGATANFDLSLDLTKIMNSGFSNIYTFTDSLKIQVAGNALPMEETVVPVGVNIAAAGEYTFRMPDGTEGMVVELVDYETNTRTNLLLSDYIVTLPKGTSENRFALHIQPQKDVVTSLENIGEEVNNGEAVNKYLIDGKLIIRTAEGIFDAQGHRL